MADIAGCEYCLGSCPPLPNIDEPGLVERHKAIGSVDEEEPTSVGRSGGAMALIKSVSTGVWEGCKVADAVEEANKLANTLLLLVPVLLELLLLLQLPFKAAERGASSTTCGEFSGISEKQAKKKMENFYFPFSKPTTLNIQTLKGTFFFTENFRTKREITNGFLSLDHISFFLP